MIGGITLLSACIASAGSMHWEGFAGARVNPLGQTQEVVVGPRLPLWEDPDDLLMANSYVFVGPKVALTPAFVSGGAYLRVMPASIARLDVFVERIASWTDADDLKPDGALPISQATLDQIALTGAIIGDGWRTTSTLLLQVKAGPIAARSTGTLMGWRLDRDPESLFYDQTLDILAVAHGWGYSLDLDLLYVHTDQRPVAGLRYTQSQPLASIAGWPAGGVQRVGPVVAWTFREKRPGGAWSEPTLFVLTQWHLAHGWRLGQSTAQAIPQVGVGFSAQGDFWRWGDDR